MKLIIEVDSGSLPKAVELMNWYSGRAAKRGGEVVYIGTGEDPSERVFSQRILALTVEA